MTDKKTAPIGSPPARIVNKAGVAVFFGVSPQSVDAWIRRGLPALERGTQGKPWRFDLLEVARWRFSPSAGTATEGDPDPANMAPRERLDHFRALREQAKHEVEMRQLIPAAEFESGIANVIKPIATGLESLPDLLERDVGLTGAQVEKAIATCDALRESLYRALGGTDA
jgi:phage terminase Nu1 subunit (DNA packaging protein)